MQSSQTRSGPTVLLILDGWGVASPGAGNAISRARTPNFDRLTRVYFTTILHAAGEAVGLRWGEMGNSEVGHLTIGAGRTVFQIQPRIDRAIIDGSFFTNKVLLKAMTWAKDKGVKLHLLGLLSDTGVHATVEHLYALLELAQQQGLYRVLLHTILDGRDSPRDSGLRFMRQLQDRLSTSRVGQVASISGRFWAMDRDNKWQRVERAYRAITVPGLIDAGFSDPLAAIEASYRKGIFDEQFEPVTMVKTDGSPVGLIEDRDSVIFYNFRPDRARQLTRALTDQSFDKFKHPVFEELHMVTLAQYDETLPVSVAFPPELIDQVLTEVVARAGLKQIHVAETEKYAHVTYFINGGREKPYPGEERILIPSLGVDSYETKPAMSAPDIRERIVTALRGEVADFYVINFANVDMVGHTGNLKATISAVETVDSCLGEIVSVTLEKQGVVIITADHGNAESLIKLNTGEVDKEHSARPVPFMVAGSGFERDKPLDEPPNLSNLTPGGFLSDVAPTILKIMGLPQPGEMTGRSLV